MAISDKDIERELGSLREAAKLERQLPELVADEQLLPEEPSTALRAGVARGFMDTQTAMAERMGIPHDSATFGRENRWLSEMSPEEMRGFASQMEDEARTQDPHAYRARQMSYDENGNPLYSGMPLEEKDPEINIWPAAMQKLDKHNKRRKMVSQ